jgi:hypothetical protein
MSLATIHLPPPGPRPQAPAPSPALNPLNQLPPPGPHPPSSACLALIPPSPHQRAFPRLPPPTPPLLPLPPRPFLAGVAGASGAAAFLLPPLAQPPPRPTCSGAVGPLEARPQDRWQGLAQAPGKDPARPGVLTAERAGLVAQQATTRPAPPLTPLPSLPSLSWPAAAALPLAGLLAGAPKNWGGWRASPARPCPWPPSSAAPPSSHAPH